MRQSFRKLTTALATATIAGLMAMPAKAVLTLEVTASTTTDFNFRVTGDFSGYTPPPSRTNHLYIVPMDAADNPLLTWVPSEQTGARPDGAIDGNTITGWVFVEGDARSDDFSFVTGDGFNVQFGSGPYDASSVMTADYERNETGLTLNPAGIDHFNLYWGREVLVATTAAAPPPPPAAPAQVPTLPAYGLALTMLGMLLVAARRLRRANIRRAR